MAIVFQFLIGTVLNSKFKPWRAMNQSIDKNNPHFSVNLKKANTKIPYKYHISYYNENIAIGRPTFNNTYEHCAITVLEVIIHLIPEY